MKRMSFVYMTLVFLLLAVDISAPQAMTNAEFLAFCGSAPASDLEHSENRLSKILQENPRLNVNFQDAEGRTPLMIVAANKMLDAASEENRRADYLRALLDKGADVNLQDKAGNTALMHAIATDPWPSVVWELIDGNANFELKNKNGETALDMAAYKASNLEVLGLLLGAPRFFGNKPYLDEVASVRIRELAQKNRNPQVRAFLNKADLSFKDKKWKPLFIAMPTRPELQEEIKQTARRIFSLAKDHASPGHILRKYLLWQTYLAEIFQSFITLGHDKDGAWHEAYLQMAEAISSDDPESVLTIKDVAAKLMAQGEHRSEDGSWKPLFVQSANDILIAETARGLTGYEASSGKELWTSANAGCQYATFHNLLISLRAVQDDGLLLIAVIDTNNGKTLWQGGNPEYWLTDAERKHLLIVAGMDIVTFDITRYGQQGWMLRHTIKVEKNADNEIEFDTAKGVADFATKSGFNLSDFFAPTTGDDGIKILKKGLAGCVTKNPYIGDTPVQFELANKNKLNSGNTLALEPYGFNQFSLWHSGQQKHLVIFDRLEQKFNPLNLPQISGQQVPLTYGDLALITAKDDWGQGVNRAAAAFAVTGSVLGIGDKKGDLHFFASNGNWVGTASATMSVSQAGKKIGDLQLVSILDASDTQKPLVKCQLANKPDELLVVRLDLAKNIATVLPRPSDPETQAITAFALARTNKAAVACEGGSLWSIDLKNGKLKQSDLKTASAWTAMTFSDDGNFLALADKSGRIVVVDKDEKIVWSSESGLAEINKLAIDTAGQRVWAMRYNTADVDAPVRVVLLTQGVQPTISKSKFKDLKGATGFRFDKELNMATILIWGHPLEEDKKNQRNSEIIVDKDAQLQIKSCVGDFYLDDLRFDEMVFSAFAKENIIDMANDGSHLILEGGYEYTQAFNPNYAYNFSLDKIYRLSAEGNSTSTTASSAFSHDNTLVALGEESGSIGSRFLVYDLQSGKLMRKMLDSNKHPHGISNIAFLHDKPNYLLTAGKDGTVRLWDLKPTDPVNILTWAFFKNGNHVVTGADYRFDTADLDKLDGVHWVMDSRPGKTAALASLMKAYFQPRLAEYVLANKKLPELPNIENLNLAQHGVRFIGVEPEKDAPGKVAVTVEVYVRGKDENHPAQELKLFRDGQLVGKYTGENNGLFDLPDGKRQVTFRNIALPQGKTQVMFKSWAFNNDGVRSKYFDKPYTYKPAQAAKPQLHLLSVGVNTFDNPAWNLNLAASDAKGYAEILPPKLPGVTTNVRLMTTEDGQDKPTKTQLKAALRDLAGKSSPDDVVLVTIASHGMTDDKSNQFYIMPSDIPGEEKKVTPELLAHSISSDELSEWLTGVDAGEFIMILDTCQSGAALGGESFKPGPMGDRGLGQIAYDKAMRVLTATNENNAAMEVGALGHGLLSYALLVDGLEKGRVRKDTSGNFTFGEWLTYGKKRTAELYADIASGKNPAQTRGKVKVTKTKDNANPPLGQEPYLFDFAQQKDGKVMIRVQ